MKIDKWHTNKINQYCSMLLFRMKYVQNVKLANYVPWTAKNM